MKVVPTYTATIYCGLRLGYTGPAMEAEVLATTCQSFANDVGLCVTFTPTEFIYTKGREPGVIVGLINYPRFPAAPERIKALALDLAGRLMDRAKQQRVTVVFTDCTVTLEQEGA